MHIADYINPVLAGDSCIGFVEFRDLCRTLRMVRQEKNEVVLQFASNKMLVGSSKAAFRLKQRGFPSAS